MRGESGKNHDPGRGVGARGARAGGEAP